MTLSGRERTGLAGLAILLAVVGTYGRFLHAEFVYDDYAVAGDNRFIRDARNLPLLLSPAYYRLADENTYRPVTTLTYFADYALWGAEPFGFNFTGMLVHFLGGILVLFLSRRFAGLSRWTALLAALVFVLHPVATEAVASEGNREEALAVPFFLGALLLHLRGDGARRPHAWRIGAAAVFAVGLFAMEMTIALPAVLAVVEWTRRRGGAPPDRRELARRLLPTFGVACLFLVGRFTIYVGTGDFTRFPGGGRLPALLTALTAWASYLRLLILPVNLHVIYDFPIARTFLDARVLSALAVDAAVLAAGARLAARGRWEGVAVLWFLLVLLPVSNAIVPFWILFSERYLYPVLPAFALLIAGLAARAAGTSRIRRAATAFCAVAALALLAAGTAARLAVWRTSRALWADNVAKAPGALDARYNLAIDLLRRGEPDAALAQFEEAARRHPEAAGPLLQQAAIHAQAGRRERARELLDRVLALDPVSAEAFLRRGHLEAEDGRFEEAARFFERALAADPGNAAALAGLAGAQLARGDRPGALAAARRALSLDPREAMALQVVAHLAAAVGDRKGAVRYYADVVRFAEDPALAAAAMQNIRRLNARRGDG